MSVATLRAESPLVHNCALSHEIGIGMIVRCQDGPVGRIAGLAPAWSEYPTHVIVQTGRLIQRDIALPLQWVAHVTGNQVMLRVRRRHVSRVLPCVTDELLEAEVREVLYCSSEFRANDAFQSIAVTVRDHEVTLQGNVRTLWRALLAETITRQVRGVWNVQNELIGDDELEDAVLHTLRRDSRLRLPPLHVRASLGQVTLTGQVRTAEEVAQVLLLVRRVPGVRTIDNQLVVNHMAHRPPSVVDGHVLFAARRTMRAGAS